MQSTTEAPTYASALPPQLPFRSLSDLVREHFQVYGTGILDPLLKGVEEINKKDIPFHQLSLRAQATQTLLNNFRIRYLRSQQYVANKQHCKIYKEIWLRAREDCRLAREAVFASEFRSVEPKGYDVKLVNNASALANREEHFCEQYHRMAQEMDIGLFNWYCSW